MKKSKFAKIEKKWQEKWEKSKIFETDLSKKPKFFLTIPYPYVNGGMHIGAGFTFLRGDTYTRFKRMNGFNTLYPQAFHATGEPIVGAIERLDKKDPVQISTFKLFGATDADIKNFVKHGPEFTAKYWMGRWIKTLKMAGSSVDWRRTFITTTMTPTYSRFVEWQYNTLRKKGYVVQGTHPVIWCPH
ncbi:MAG: class I tRNA ligase family protein, partial [Candidatus Aenigmatarchaeota archaeon]